MNKLIFLLASTIFINTINIVGAHSARLAEKRKQEYAAKEKQRKEMNVLRDEKSAMLLVSFQFLGLSYEEKLINAAKIVEEFKLKKNKSLDKVEAVVSDVSLSSLTRSNTSRDLESSGQCAERLEVQDRARSSQEQRDREESKELSNTDSSKTLPAREIVQRADLFSNSTLSDVSAKVGNVILESQEEDPYRNLTDDLASNDSRKSVDLASNDSRKSVDLASNNSRKSVDHASNDSRKLVAVSSIYRR